MSAVSWSEISARLFLHLNIGLKGVGVGGGGEGGLQLINLHQNSGRGLRR